MDFRSSVNLNLWTEVSKMWAPGPRILAKCVDKDFYVSMDILTQNSEFFKQKISMGLITINGEMELDLPGKKYLPAILTIAWIKDPLSTLYVDIAFEIHLECYKYAVEWGVTAMIPPLKRWFSHRATVGNDDILYFYDMVRGIGGLEAARMILAQRIKMRYENGPGLRSFPVAYHWDNVTMKLLCTPDFPVINFSAGANIQLAEDLHLEN